MKKITLRESDTLGLWNKAISGVRAISDTNVVKVCPLLETETIDDLWFLRSDSIYGCYTRPLKRITVYFPQNYFELFPDMVFLQYSTANTVCHEGYHAMIDGLGIEMTIEQQHENIRKIWDRIDMKLIEAFLNYRDNVAFEHIKNVLDDAIQKLKEEIKKEGW